MARRTVYEYTVSYRSGSASTFAANTQHEAERKRAAHMLAWRRQPVGGRILNVGPVRAKVIGR